MLQLQLLRTQKDHVIDRLKVKNVGDLSVVDSVLALDEERRKVQTENDDFLAKINTASKEIGKLMASGNKDEAEKMKADVAAYKESTKVLGENLAKLEKQQHDELVKLPNLPHESVPLGKTPEENEVVRMGNDIPVLYDGAVPHWDLAKKYTLIDFELGNKITGAGFPVYVNKGARLQRGLINYFLDFNTEAGYIEHQVPHMVNGDSAYATGQLLIRKARCIM